MKLIDLKRPKLSKKELKAQMEVSPVEVENERYPWGFRLNLELEEIDKLDELKKAKVGDELSMQAVCKVVATHVSANIGDKKRHNLEIQIQKVAFKDMNDAEGSFDED